MKAWHEVGSLADVEREGRILARIDGREIGVVRNPEGGELHALRNRCPHSGAPLCLGSVRRRETGEPGRYAVGDKAVLHCPWHGWEFDVDSGHCLDDEMMRVAVYPVRIEAGRVFVQA